MNDVSYTYIYIGSVVFYKIFKKFKYLTSSIRGYTTYIFLY